MSLLDRINYDEFGQAISVTCLLDIQLEAYEKYPLLYVYRHAINLALDIARRQTENTGCFLLYAQQSDVNSLEMKLCALLTLP